MSRVIALLLLCSLPYVLIGQSDMIPDHICYQTDERGRYREHNVDMKHLKLEVRFDLKESMVFGTASYQFQPLQMSIDTLFLDGPGIVVEEATLDGKTIRHSTDEDGITLYFPNSLDWEKDYDLSITYECEPKKGIYFIGWNDPQGISREQIWTQGQGIDNRHWIPCYDTQNDKLTTETIIHFEDGYEVLSNGDLLSSKTKNGIKTWHYKLDQPHTTYLIMVGIGKYKYKDLVAKNGIVSRQYYYPDLPETFEPSYQYSVEMMDWCVEEFGVPYPWKTYANIPVQDFLYGAMENTTATIFTDYYIQDRRGALERNYVGTNAHELVHMWFGDYVTAWSGTHHWLHESFATHYAKHFRKHVYGDDWYQWNRRQEMIRAWEANKRDQYPVAHSQAGSSRHYPKGSIVLDMMRYVLGDVQYRKAVTHFLKKHEYDMVDSHDFYISFMESLGTNMDWFFDQWVYRGGEPHYEIKFETVGELSTFYVEQTHEVSGLVGYFNMPIIFEVHYTDGSFDEQRVWIDGPIDTVSFETNSKAIDYALFDPNWNILKTVDFPKDYDMLVAQASKAKNMIDRYDALRSLASHSVEDKLTDLIAIYNNEPFHANKEEIIRQVANAKIGAAQNLVKKAINDPDHQVRRAAIDFIDTIPQILVEDYMKLLKDDSYVTIEKTLEQLSKDYPGNRQVYLSKVKGVEGMNKNVRIVYLQEAARDNPEAHLAELTDYLSESYEFRTRLNAMEAVQELDHFSDDVIGHLINGVLHFNRRLRNPSTDAINFFIYQDKKYRKQFEKYVTSREWEEEDLEKLTEKFFE